MGESTTLAEVKLIKVSPRIDYRLRILNFKGGLKIDMRRYNQNIPSSNTFTNKHGSTMSGGLQVPLSNTTDLIEIFEDLISQLENYKETPTYKSKTSPFIRKAFINRAELVRKMEKENDIFL